MEVNSLGEGGALVRKKLVGFVNVSLEEPSVALDRFGERKIAGSIFSESFAESKSKLSAFRLEGEVKEVIAI